MKKIFFLVVLVLTLTACITAAPKKVYNWPAGSYILIRAIGPYQESLEKQGDYVAWLFPTGTPLDGKVEVLAGGAVRVDITGAVDTSWATENSLIMADTVGNFTTITFIPKVVRYQINRYNGCPGINGGSVGAFAPLEEHAIK